MYCLSIGLLRYKSFLIHTIKIPSINTNMIFDLHNDLITSGLPERYVKSVIKNNAVSRVVYAFWTTKAFKSSKLSNKIILKNNNFKLDKNFKLVEKKFKSLAKSAEGSFFAIEDLHFVNKLNLDALVKLPLLYCGLTWNYDNDLAGGAYGKSGLTDWGKEVINALNCANIIVDTAHLNEKSFYDVIEKSESVINSHSALDEVFSHPRNLKRAQIQAIIERGGIIGLTPVTDFMGGKGLGAYVNQIDKFFNAYGDNNVCIGTDFYGTVALDELKKYDDFVVLRYRLENLGYASESIDKLFYKNAENYLINRLAMKRRK